MNRPGDIPPARIRRRAPEPDYVFEMATPEVIENPEDLLVKDGQKIDLSRALVKAGKEMAFSVEQTRTDGTTFSAEALERLTLTIGQWITSQVGAEWEGRGWSPANPPKTMRVMATLKLEFD